jgi:RHS repeat-associated protein
VSLEDQAFDPVPNPIEMHQSWPEAVSKLKAHPDYPDLFFDAFGTREIDSLLVVKAIAQFERTLISSNSKWDRYLRGEVQLTQAESKGFEIFFTEKGDCFHCHTTILFTDQIFHNNGLDATHTDKGLFDVTGDVNDVGKFKTPTLRNLDYTAPYMPDGRFETFDHDAMGNVVEHTDAAGRTTRFGYAPTRKLESVVRVLAGGGAVTNRFEYDRQFNMLNLTDGEDRVVESYSLDLLDRPVAVTNLEGQALSVAYGLGHMVLSVDRFDGTTVSNAYDAGARLSHTYYPSTTLAFGYYANGLLKSAVNEAGGVFRSYDGAGRLISETGTTHGTAVSYTYLPAGNVTNLTTVAGTTSYTYDEAERVTRIADGRATFGLSYHPHHGLGSSCTNAESGLSVSYAYDVVDRITDIHWRDGANATLRRRTYAYDDAGMVTSVVMETGAENVFDYDGLGRLTRQRRYSASSSLESDVVWVYDAAGNRTQMIDDIETNTYALGFGNRLWTWGTNAESSVHCDAAGCVTNLGYAGAAARRLEWNDRYQLAAVYTNGSLAETCRYDALGRRVSVSDGTATNYLVHDGIHLVAEVDAAGGLVRSYTHGPGIDHVLAMTVHGDETNTYYYLTDHLGSVVAVADEDGAVVESYEYDAWGNVTVHDATGGVLTASAIGNRFTFQGREISWATGLYNFRARWYDPVTGRWLSKDPIGISGGLNQYVFADNNPVNFRDPFGLCSDDGDNYWVRSGKQLLFGNFTDEVTLAGTGGQVGLGLLGVDLPLDIRDIGADLINWEWSWGHAGQTGLDIIGVLPLIGALKYGDEASDLIKSGRKARRLKNLNKAARKQVNSVAQEFGISGAQRKQLGKYIERMKRMEGRGGADNYSYDELRDITQEFLEGGH